MLPDSDRKARAFRDVSSLHQTRGATNRPMEVHLGVADPTIPNFEIEETLPTA